MRKLSIAIAATIAVAGLVPQAALADKVKLQTKDAVEGQCNEKGGVFWPDSAGHTYGCFNRDGSGIVCGGVSKDDKKSCDTWPASARIGPSRSQVRGWIKAAHPAKG